MGKKQEKNKSFNLRSQYSKSWRYIKESRNFIYLVIGLFLFFILVGFFIPMPSQLQEQILKFIEELILHTQDMSQWELIWFIFTNNLQSGFSAILFGVFLEVFPILSTIVNGYILGFVSLLAVNEGSFLVLWRLLPHGIFELPAILISFGMGIKIGEFFFSAKDKSKAILYLLASTAIFVGLSLILFFVINLVVSISMPGNLGSTSYLDSIMSNPFISFLFLVLFIGGFYLSKSVLDKKDKKEFLRRVRESLRVFIFIVLPLLVIAAIIEGSLIYLFR